MKKYLLGFVIVLILASCKKEKRPIITATVQQQGGCLPNTWMVLITSGGADKYPFLCASPSPTSSLNCSNAVFINNMPASLSQLGKRIKFSKWEDNGIFCLSDSRGPHHLDVSDISAE
jgi:hypothetical protein